MALRSQALAVLAALASGQVSRPVKRGRSAPRSSGWDRWLGEPRNAVFLVMASALGIGGGRKVLQWWSARKAIARLAEANPSVADVEAAARHGRTGLIDLFRLLGTGETESLRFAAGRALASLWAQDQLIAEEEQALVRRGYAVHWRARRRYPRSLQAPIPISVSYGVPFLEEGTSGVAPTNLEWSHRLLGAKRASLETPSPWTAGHGRALFSLIPDDFASSGPHRLELVSRVRTVGLTDPWEIALPHIPFQVEFDPLLAREALFALADESRGEQFARAVQLGTGVPDDSGSDNYLDLNEALTLRNPPVLVIVSPLPCDLAHSVALEFEGVTGQFAAGSVVRSGQGSGQEEPPSTTRFRLGPVAALPLGAIDRPGPRRLRAVLSADPDLGWADPEVRSIWPGSIATEWVEAEVLRR